MSPGRSIPAVRRPSERRGSAYIAVLGISLLVSTIGLGAMLAIRSQRRAADLRNDEGEARGAGQAAMEAAARSLALDASWRTTYTNNTYSSARAFGRGTLSFKLVDEVDGNLSDDPMEPVRLYSAGRTGGAARVESVVLAPTGPALDVLQTAAYSAGGLNLSGTAYSSLGPVGCGGVANVALLAAFSGNIECGSLVNLGTVNGTVTTGAAARSMPSASLYGTYSTMATAIPYSSLLSGTLSKKLLSAASNPYGTANASGVYFIDVPALSTLTITQSRLAATLVVNLGLSATLTITGPVAWDAPEKMPALIVRGAGLGTVNINGSVSPLSEATASANFNPPSTPYFGNSNATTTETYPPEVRGLIHIIGGTVSTNIGSNAIIRGCCVAEGSIAISGGATLFAEPALFASPPSGYITPTGLAVQASTWRREQDN